MTNILNGDEVKGKNHASKIEITFKFIFKTFGKKS
tara:strand:- start:484 stop:588 length:105 start_codon:yes stop_codon:yes gene_type:complete